ncbi:ammonia-dependent NAD(+) synthetase [Amnibacterium flavum]|uniref:NH(3)-dependent NAD(+) synthetase n=1 Tax=Amnibacterium flavum TaxID=2173173 RepID=A0A2V1HSU3_9MICO|nr:ammonia-dependent NAD(+) synthetase [Amnibacterium flavum]PVZ95638.1 NAD(+) synthase [Amnibacterium flavum]
MRELQATIIADLNVEPTIDAAEQVRRRVDFLKDYLRKTGAAGFLLAISGGQDSSLAGKLAQQAVEELRADGTDAVFFAVRMPHKVQADEEDAQLALEFIQPDRRLVFNIERPVAGFDAEFGDSTGEPIRDFTRGNVKARSRMVGQYAIAGQHNLLVIGTDHAAEAVMGFFTKFGDGGADLLPLTGLSKRQGRALLEHLDSPERLWLKAPTADLLDDDPGQTDEANLGITYREIDDFLEGKDIDPEIAEKIEQRYLSTEHKRRPPVSMFDDWWR